MPSIVLDSVQHSILSPDRNVWKISSCFGDEDQNPSCGLPRPAGFGPAHLSSLI